MCGIKSSKLLTVLLLSKSNKLQLISSRNISGAGIPQLMACSADASRVAVTDSNYNVLIYENNGKEFKVGSIQKYVRI